jgi:hypothetical protein
MTERTIAKVRKLRGGEKVVAQFHVAPGEALREHSFPAENAVISGNKVLHRVAIRKTVMHPWRKARFGVLQIIENSHGHWKVYATRGVRFVVVYETIQEKQRYVTTISNDR